ncbi:FAD-binding protein [Streptomyces sp. NPDC050988]|uniref:FAD-binding protein n=1 Tax=Streptomyces sp. NPDC050988 TaxID=3365637 RepID=UPI00379683EE
MVAAATTADVQAAVGFAAAHGMPVGVMATGHQPFPVTEGFLLITTGALSTVEIDAGRAVARVGAGARWKDVVSPLRLRVWHRCTGPHRMWGWPASPSAAVRARSWAGPTAGPPTMSTRSRWSPRTARGAGCRRSAHRSCSGGCAADAATSASSPNWRSACSR